MQQSLKNDSNTENRYLGLELVSKVLPNGANNAVNCLGPILPVSAPPLRAPSLLPLIPFSAQLTRTGNAWRTPPRLGVGPVFVAGRDFHIAYQYFMLPGGPYSYRAYTTNHGQQESMQS